MNTGRDLDQEVQRFDQSALERIVGALLGDEAPEERRSEVSKVVAEEFDRIGEETAGTPAPESNRAYELYGLFKYLAHDRKGRTRWQALRAQRKGVDRDRVVLELWRLIESQHGAAVVEHYHSIAYHRQWLSDWFTTRYDLRRARRVLGLGGGMAGLHLALLAGVAGVVALRMLDTFGPHPALGSAIALAALYTSMAGILAGSIRRANDDLSMGEAIALGLQTFVPRLAGAAAVGLVVLAASQELLKLVVDKGDLGWAVALLAAAYGYLVLEMARRIHPLPRPRRLALHAFDVWATGFAHSLALTLVAEGGLRFVLEPVQPGRLAPVQLLSCATFIFVIGLVLNLIWAEQPVTEPL